MDDTSNRHFRSSDDVDVTFAEAVVHKSGHTVLGFRLRPFSFWHAANLDFVESPFSGHNNPIDFAALYVACRICRLRYPHSLKRGWFAYLRELWKIRKYRPVNITRRALRKVRKGDSIAHAPGHVKKPTSGKKVPRNVSGKAAFTFPLLAELNKFSAYMRDYMSRPDYISSEKSESIKTPWYLYEVALYRRFNPEKTWAQCWDTPIGEAAWHNAAMFEASGVKIEILTPEMRKTFDEIDRLSGA